METVANVFLPIPKPVPCRHCRSEPISDPNFDNARRLCGKCKTLPEAAHLLSISRTVNLLDAGGKGAAVKPRDFNLSEKSLIKRLHGDIPAEQLLAILNERLIADLGDSASPHSMEQLHAEIGGVIAALPPGGHDWASLRKLLTLARRDGTLDIINEQVIDDFAVIFSLSTKQLMQLKDILLQADGSNE